MGITVNASEVPVFQRLRQKGLKSREEKMERQQNRDNQVAVLEKQKADLKNMECGSLEEIKDKLELLHSYDDQVSAVKQAYNNEQMHHILDEAREKGEKIAEEIKKLAPKTKEEREEILQEEALGIEEDQGLLSELTEEITEEVTEELAEKAAEKTAEMTEEAAESAEDLEIPTKEMEESIAEEPVLEITEDVSKTEAQDIAEQSVLGQERAMEDSTVRESLVMHGKTGDEISRYLDYYKLL